MVTNPKIEKKKSEIARTEAMIAEHKTKLNKLKQELTALENEEIVALFRREDVTDANLAALRQLSTKPKNNGEPNKSHDEPQERKEEKPDEEIEN